MVSAMAVLGLAATLATAAAQQYPSRTVTIIVPYPAGGPTDETARMIAQSLSTQLKQSFVVEDVGGGGAIIGSEKVARATPDGYTLLIHNLQITANVSLYENLPFDTVKSFRAGDAYQSRSIGVGRPQDARAEHAWRSCRPDETT